MSPRNNVIFIYYEDSINPIDSSDCRGGSRRGRSPPLKLTKVTLFTMIFYHPDNGIRDIRPFCRPLFCHSSVVKYTSDPLAVAKPL